MQSNIHITPSLLDYLLSSLEELIFGGFEHDGNTRPKPGFLNVSRSNVSERPKTKPPNQNRVFQNRVRPQAAPAAGSQAGPGPRPDRLGFKCYLAWGGTRVVGAS